MILFNVNYPILSVFGRQFKVFHKPTNARRCSPSFFFTWQSLPAERSVHDPSKDRYHIYHAKTTHKLEHTHRLDRHSQKLDGTLKTTRQTMKF